MSIRVITGCEPELTQWIAERLGMYLGVGATLGFAENGKLLAGIFYAMGGYPSASVEMSIFAASPRWATRRTLHAAFSYPFLQRRAKRCVASIAVDNRPAREFVERLGFRLEGVGREAWLTGDCAVYGMIQSECRWLHAAPPRIEDIDVVCPPLMPANEPLARAT